MFHSINIGLTKKQAERMNLPHLVFPTKGEKEKELADIEKALKEAKSQFGIQGVVTGAQASNYQKDRIEAICKKLGLTALSPLWHKDPATLLREELALGFKTLIVQVAAHGFTEKWLGREINETCIQDLEKLHARYKIHVGAEGGEYESFVLDCPLFSKPLRVKSIKKIWKGDKGHTELEIK